MADRPTYKELKSMSDDDLIAKIDARLDSRHYDPAPFIGELNARGQSRINDQMMRHTRWMTGMTVAILLFTAINVGIFAWQVFCTA